MPKDGTNKIIGVIAGNGSLPFLIQQSAAKKNIKTVFAFINIKPDLDIKSDYITTGFGQVGKILKFFKKHQVSDIIFAGGVTKPDFSSLKLDIKGFLLLSKILKNKVLGDDALLTTIIKYLEKHRFNVMAVDDLVENLHLAEGDNSKTKCPKSVKEDIDIAREILNSTAKYDIGQSIIIQNKRVLAIEGAEGTDNMIIRTSKYIEPNKKKPAILVKLKKATQDRRVDLPTIGIQTIENLSKSNIAGIVFDATDAIIIDRKAVIDAADKHKIFIYGI